MAYKLPGADVLQLILNAWGYIRKTAEHKGEQVPNSPMDISFNPTVWV